MMFNQSHHLSKAQIQKNADRLYKSAFGDIPEETVYHDPMGARTGQPVNAKQQIWQEWQDSGMLEEFERVHSEKGWPLEASIEHIAKNFDTGDWSLPVFHQPQIQVVQPEQTPMADMIARQTVNRDSINVTSQTDHPEDSVEFGLENTSDTEGSYTYADGSQADNSFDVVGYGLASRLEDKLVLANDPLRNTSSFVEQVQATAIRQAVERQIIQGTNFNANGWSGFDQLGSQVNDIDITTSVTWTDQVRQLVDEVEFQGGNPGSIAVVTDFDTHREIRNELDTEARYREIGQGDEFNFGFRALTFDDVPILKSHAITRQSQLSGGADNNGMYAVDMSSIYMGMLQDLAVKPLAKVAPQEQFATDAYGVMVDESDGNHIRFHNFSN